MNNKSNCFVIAEAGVNHNGRLALAKRLVRVAALAGADAVKFQTFRTEQVVTKKGQMVAYQKKNIGKVESQSEMLSKLEFKEEWYPLIFKQCGKYGIEFMSTPHGGRASIRLLNKYVKKWKVGSGDLLNFILLDEISKTRKPVILSSGMHNLNEVRKAVRFLVGRNYPFSKVAVLHCTTNYPCPPEQVNLGAMVTMKNKLKGIAVGYSDHTEGSQVTVMAATLGARIYECHFTLDKNLPGPDHKASAEPKELEERIKMIRRASIILGDGIKRPNRIETDEMRPMVTRSIVSVVSLKKGHVLSEKDLEAKRPGDGVSPEHYERFIGRRLKKDIAPDEQILYRDVE